MAIEMIFSLIGGLGLFIYGMRIMGDGLQKAAGDKLKRLLEILTNNRLIGVIVGTAITAVIQSSSATTVMVVGFVNAGLMTLTQAVGVIMGANIGTTVTAQLIAFKLTDYALPSIGIGVAMSLFSKKRNYKYIGQILLGFGLLFLGMQTMTTAMKPLAKTPGFIDIIANFGQHPLFGVLVGIALTGIVQSSSATIGILQALAGTGVLPIEVALPILFGDNIGTTVTAMLSSIGTSITARRAAMIHSIFNIIGTMIFLTILPIVIPVVTTTSNDVVKQIANAHTMFNIINTALQLPFAGFLVMFVTKLIPGQDEIMETGPKYIDKRFLKTPRIALAQTIKEMSHMGDLVEQNFFDSIDVFLSYNEKITEKIYSREVVINRLEREITSFLAELSRTSVTVKESETITGLLNTVNDIERVGDHTKNIVELAEFKYNHQLPFSKEAISELNFMFDKVKSAFRFGMDALKYGDKQLAKKVLSQEDEIDEMEKRLRSHHIYRLNKQLCYPSSGVIYLDVISNLERMGDHSSNIAHTVIDYM